MAATQHYVMEMYIEYVHEDDSDENTKWMAIHCDFQTEANYENYEGDSFDNLDEHIESFLPENCRLERTDGGPEPNKSVEFSECNKGLIPYVLVPILE